MITGMGIITVMITAMIPVVGTMTTTTIAITTMTDAKVARARRMREPVANLCLHRTLR
jgi:hypothetical protein